MTWEFKEGHCAQCGAYGSWLEYEEEAKQLPPGWFGVERDWKFPSDRLFLCSVKCVVLWQGKGKAPDLDPASPSQPPECKPLSKK